MDIKFQSGFVKFAKMFAAVICAVFVLWAIWTWRVVIAEVGMFALISVVRAVVNTTLIVVAGYIIGWFIPWLVARYALEGVTPPRAPLRPAKYAAVAAVAAGLLLVPVDMSVHRKIARAVQPLAEQFEREASCDGYDCYAPDEVLRERDRVVKFHGGVRLGGWMIRGYWRQDGGADTSGAKYLWDAPFFVL